MKFPEISGSGDGDHDANWLMVAGEVVHGDRTWSFRDPRLLTRDVRELADWLRSVADGSRRPEPVDAQGDEGGLLFTCAVVDYDALRGIDDSEHRPF